MLGVSWLTCSCSMGIRAMDNNSTIATEATFKIFVHNVLTGSFILAVLITSKTFGSTSACNGKAIAMFFRPFNFLNVGRIIGIVAVSIMLSIGVMIQYFRIVYKKGAYC